MARDRDGDSPLRPSYFGKTPGGKHGWSEGFKRIVRHAGLDLIVVQDQGARNFAKRNFLSLRHSFSSALAKAGVSEEIRMKLTGQPPPNIHQKHSHMSMTPLKEAIDLASGSA